MAQLVGTNPQYSGYLSGVALLGSVGPPQVPYHPLGVAQASDGVPSLGSYMSGRANPRMVAGQMTNPSINPAYHVAADSKQNLPMIGDYVFLVRDSTQLTFSHAVPSIHNIDQLLRHPRLTGCANAGEFIERFVGLNTGAAANQAPIDISPLGVLNTDVVDVGTNGAPSLIVQPVIAGFCSIHDDWNLSSPAMTRLWYCIAYFAPNNIKAFALYAHTENIAEQRVRTELDGVEGGSWRAAFVMEVGVWAGDADMFQQGTWKEVNRKTPNTGISLTDRQMRLRGVHLPAISTHFCITPHGDGSHASGGFAGDGSHASGGFAGDGSHASGGSRRMAHLGGGSGDTREWQ